MPRMLELVRQSAVPAAVMRSAAHGALSLPPAEMLEIVVHLAGTKVWAEQAQLTLAGWEDADLLAVLREPSTTPAVLQYFLQPQNMRPGLLPALANNPAVADDAIVALAQRASTSAINALLTSPRAERSAPLLRALAENPCTSSAAAARIAELLCQTEPAADKEAAPGAMPQAAADEPVITEFAARFAPEIAAAEGTPFSLVEPTAEEDHELGQRPQAAGGTRVSVLTKIAKLKVSERVQLAMRGSRDERFILIRDVVRVVAVAVLESPKVADTEMEAFASMRNVSEDVLRCISRNRRFMKHYGVIRALVNNPRTPVDIGVTLLPHLLVLDLRHLTKNRNIGDLIRKSALKLYRQKSQRDPQ